MFILVGGSELAAALIATDHFMKLKHSAGHVALWTRPTQLTRVTRNQRSASWLMYLRFERTLTFVVIDESTKSLGLVI